MKKVFSIFMIFFAVFMVSCGGLLEEDSTNTVRITMPGNARSASAGGPEDVDYYNIVIQNQTFSNVQAGSTVESAQLPVGTNVSISVEAIGNINDVQGAPVITGRRIAYYQTSERLPAEGLTLNVNMANYKTEYYIVSLDMDGFDDRITSPTYVASGESYTLSDFGIVVPTGGTPNKPNKHTGWLIRIPGVDNPPSYSIGESVPITSDTTFTVQYESGITVNFSAIVSGESVVELEVDDTIYESNGQYYLFLNTPFTLPRAKKADSSGNRTEVTEWLFGSGERAGVPGEKITVSSGTSFSIQTQ